MIVFFQLYYLFKIIFIFNWLMAVSQCWSDFCHTSAWISHRCTYVPFFLNPICIILSTSWEELTHWKTLMLGGIEGKRKRDDRGWDGWMASLTRWTWVWVNSGRWWWTGRPGVLRFMGLQRVGHDWATELTDWSKPKTLLLKPLKKNLNVNLTTFSNENT